jgi:hypothetical protein
MFLINDIIAINYGDNSMILISTLSFLALNFFAGGLPAVLEEFVIFGFN